MYNILTDEEVAHLFLLFKDHQNTFIQKVVKALPDLIYVMNLDSQAIIYSSRMIALEIGYSPQQVEAMNHPILDIMHPDDRPRFLQHLQDVKNSTPGQVLPIEFRLIRHNGKIAWFVDRNTIFTRDLNGAAVTKIGITHEITARKEHVEELLKQKKIIEQSEMLAGSGSWAYDRTSGSFTWSAGMYRLFNLALGTAVQPAIYKQFCTDEDFPIAEKIVVAIQDAQFAFEEILHIAVDGQVRTLKIKADPVMDGQPTSPQMVGVDLDITASALKEKQLKQLNKELMAKNRENQYLHSDLKTFAQITATDYQTNFKKIYTSFESILTHEAAAISNRAKGALRKIQGSLQKMNLLTDDIQAYLAITKENSHLSMISLDEMLSHLLADLKDKHDGEVIINVTQLGFVMGDRQLIYVLLRHLIDNAIKFRKQDMPAVITLTSSWEELIKEGSSTRPAKTLLTICIEDNGIGIDSLETEKIFELFYKNHYDRKLRGSGVGLALARKIMNVHSGFITAESTLNTGSRFTCYFPAPVLSKS
jgi:PAS domain S-box-containing protein